MTPDDATPMVYSDGELDPLTAKRIEQAIAADPALGRGWRRSGRCGCGWPAPLRASRAKPVLAALAAPLTSNVVPLRPPARPPRTWVRAAAVAAALVLGVAVGRNWPSGPLHVSGD